MTTGIDVLDSSVQEVNEWLSDMEMRLGTTNRKQAYHALRTALHAVRDRVGRDNAVHLAAQLPLLIKGIYYDGWQPSQTPTRERNLTDFLRRDGGGPPGAARTDPEAAIRAGLGVLCDHLDPGESSKLLQLFPEKLRELWPANVLDRDGGMDARANR